MSERQIRPCAFDPLVLVLFLSVAGANVMFQTMFFRFLSVLGALLLFCSLGFAQAAPAPSAPPAPKLTRDGKPLAKEVRAGCRDEAKAKGLKPREQSYRDHMKECIGKQRPDLVKAYECRQEARDKKIEKSEIRAYVKACKVKS